LNGRTLQTAEQWIAGRRASWERRLDALDAYLATNPKGGRNRP